MTPCSTGEGWLGALVIILAALNVALNTWLVNRRYNADRREHKRNGIGCAHVSTDATSSKPSDHVSSTRHYGPRD